MIFCFASCGDVQTEKPSGASGEEIHTENNLTEAQSVSPSEASGEAIPAEKSTGSLTVTDAVSERKKPDDHSAAEKADIREMHFLTGEKKLMKLTGKFAGAYDFDIYYYGLEYINVRTGRGTRELSAALSDGEITVDDIIAFAEKRAGDDEYSGKETYKDGGSVMYRICGFSLLKLNTLDGRKDLIFGDRTMMNIDDVKNAKPEGTLCFETGKAAVFKSEKDGVKLNVSVPEKVKAGESFILTARVTNNTGKELKYTLPCCDYINHYDISVKISDGGFTDKLCYDRAHPEATREETLAPGEYYEDSLIFVPGRIISGAYTRNPVYQMAEPGKYKGIAAFENLKCEFEVIIV